MKQILLAFVVFVLFGMTAQAQYSIVNYTDTTLAGNLNSAAEQVLITARGFTFFTYLRSDIKDHNVRVMQVKFRGKGTNTLAAATSFTTDSVKIQGLLRKKSNKNALDTGWVDIEVTFEDFKNGINTASGIANYRDTTVTWIAAGIIATDAGGYVTPQFTLPDYYYKYRVVNGKADSGRVVIKELWLPRR